VIIEQNDDGVDLDPCPDSLSGAAVIAFGHLSKTERLYYPELDALRFIAFLLVFLHHTAPREASGYEGYFSKDIAEVLASATNMLGYGLPLFFFLSAFLITELLLREKLKTKTIKIGDFYIRRALRIWPLYFLGIVIGIAAAAIMQLSGSSGDYGNGRMLLMYLALCGNWYFARGATAWPSNPMTPLWSISVEEQFYLFWPIVIRFASHRTLFCVCGFIALAAIIAEQFLGSIHADADISIWTNSFVQFEIFAAGAAVALYLNGNTPRFHIKTRMSLAMVSLFLWFASAYWFQAKYIGPASSGLSIVIGYFFIASGCATAMLSILGIRRTLPLLVIYLGRISFGLYVFHLLAIEIVAELDEHSFAMSGWRGAGLDAAASLLLTISLAALSYRFLETPFLRLKERFAAIASRPI
jgi:peptidoglycan/LPS O-acetylase OafA/YrhL